MGDDGEFKDVKELTSDEEETVEESFGDCGCKMTNKAKETWEVLTDSDKQLELRDMGVDEGYAYYPFEHLPKKIGEAFVDKFNTKENGDSLGWNKITALERADTLRKIGFTPRDSELVSNLEYQQLSESLKKDVDEALNYKVKAQESQVPQDKSQEKFENGLYSNMYDGYLERRGARVDSKKKAKILENNNFGLDISKVKGVEATVTKDIWDNIDDIIFRLTLLERAGYEEDLRTGYYSGKETWDKLAELSNNEVTGALSGVQISEQEIKETTNTGYFPDMFGGRVDRWGDKYEDNDPYVYESKASEKGETYHFLWNHKEVRSKLLAQAGLSDEHSNKEWNEIPEEDKTILKLIMNDLFYSNDYNTESKASEGGFENPMTDEDWKRLVEHYEDWKKIDQVYPTRNDFMEYVEIKGFNSHQQQEQAIAVYDYYTNRGGESKATEDMKWWECEDCKFFGKTEDETNKHELETGHTTYGAGMTSAFPTFLKSKKTESYKASENIADFKSELDTAWFDRSGDTDGIAVGRQNELKYANADDFEAKNPSLFERMYKHWINNPDDTFDDDSSFSWESKANEYLPDHFDLDEERMEEQDEDLSLEDRVVCRRCGKKYDLEEYEHEDLNKHLLEIHNIRNVDESKANEIKNYLGIELDSISQMIDKIRNGTIDNHHLSRFADYHGLPEGWTKEDIIDEIRVYEGMEDELDFEGREDGEISQIRSLLYGYESKATEDMESQQRGLSDSEEEELMEQTLEEWQTRYLPYESAGQDVSYNAFSSFAKSKNLTQSEIDYLWNEGGANPYSSGTEAQVMGTPITNNDKFGREWGFSIINHGYGAGSETPYEVGIFLHDEIHKKNDVKGWLNEEEALYYKAKFEVDPIDTFRSIGGQMDSIINPDFVEQTEDNWNLWESLQDSGEASLSDPDNKKYNMDTDFGFSYSDKDIEALDAETDIDLSVDKEATEENPNRDDDGQFTSDLPEEKNEDYGRDPYHGKVDVPFVEAKESKSKAEEALDKGASAEKIYSLVDDKGTDDDRSESEEEYLNNLYNKTNANKSTGFSDLQ